MVDIVLLHSFVLVEDSLLELLKNYQGSLEEIRWGVSVSWSWPKVFEDIGHCLTRFFFFSVQTYFEFKLLRIQAIRSGNSELENIHSIRPLFLLWWTTFSPKFWKGWIRKKMSPWGDSESSYHKYLLGGAMLLVIKDFVK